ncbi:MAG: hypothetical protein KAI70_00735 [Candidatus Omnitrophica bacterium]|nr:hypothetical protein [Candidatus Omnitrophota bacterium]
MMPGVTEVGVAGVVTYVLLKEILSFLKAMKVWRFGSSKIDPCKDMIGKIVSTLNDTYRHGKHVDDMLSEKDMDGVHLWRVPRSLEKSIETLAVNVKEQTEIIRELVLTIKYKNEVR